MPRKPYSGRVIKEGLYSGRRREKGIFGLRGCVEQVMCLSRSDRLFEGYVAGERDITSSHLGGYIICDKR